MGITINATGITFNDSSVQTTKFANISLGFTGVQSWQNVTSSRTLTANYTNNTTRPIMVLISNAPSASNQLAVKITGTNVVSFSIPYTGSSGSPGACFIVPNGSSYSVGGIDPAFASPITSWFELR